MKTTKIIHRDIRGNFIEHGGVKYRPQIATALKTGFPVQLEVPHVRTDDSWATVEQGDVSEKWEPQV